MKFVMEEIDDAVPKGQPTTKLCIYAENNKEQKFLEALAEFLEEKEIEPPKW